MGSVAAQVVAPVEKNRRKKGDEATPVPGTAVAESAGEVLTGPGCLPAVDVQRTWFELVRQAHWRVLAVVPGDEGFSTWPLAQGLATMAALDPAERVLLVRVEAEPAAAPGRQAEPTAETTEVLAEGLEVVAAGRYQLLDCGRSAAASPDLVVLKLPRLLQAIGAGSHAYTRAIMATGCPVSQVAVLPALRAADAAAVAVALGKTRFAAAAQVAQLVEPAALLGAVALKPRREARAPGTLRRWLSGRLPGRLR